VRKVGLPPLFLPFFVQSQARNIVLNLGRKNFLDDLSNSDPSFDYIVKAGQTARPKTTETKEKESCHSIWLLITSPTTSTRPR
jgi:hypothetical protein